MQSFTSIDLQQHTGEIQRAAISVPVVITDRGRLRMMMMTVEKLVRLKQEDAEPVPPELRNAGTIADDRSAGLRYARRLRHRVIYGGRRFSG